MLYGRGDGVSEMISYLLNGGPICHTICCMRGRISYITCYMEVRSATRYAIWGVVENSGGSSKRYVWRCIDLVIDMLRGSVCLS